MDQDLDKRAETKKLLEEDIGTSFCNLILDSDFLYMTQKAQAAKLINRISSKLRQWKDNPQNRWKYFQIVYLVRDFFFFNWRLFTLQYCGVFFAIQDMNQPWVYMCSPSWPPLPLPSPSHPSGSSQCTSPEHPASCIKPGLVICFTYDNIHVSVLFSQIIPPSPSPTESNNLFFTSVSLLLSHI